MNKNIIYYISSAILAVIVVYKAATMSMTCDESSSYYYLRDTNVLGFLFDKNNWPNANNHWLNTLSFQFTTSIFGVSELMIRLSNVISFFFFLYFTFQISKEIKNQYLRFSSFALVLFNPYLLDFFSTARGYGMANTGIIGAVYFLGKYFENKKYTSLIATMGLILFSVLSLFSTIIFLPAILGAAIVYILISEKNNFNFRNHTSFFVVSGISTFVILLLSYIPISALSKNEEFKWGAQDLFTGLKTLVTNSIYGKNYGVNEFFIVGFVSCLVVYGFFKLLEYIKASDNIEERKYFYIKSASLIIVFLLMFVARYLWNSYYPEDRKTTIFLPFVSMIIFSGLDSSRSNYKNIIGILLSIVFVLHFFLSFSKDSVREWWFDVHTKDFYQKINNEAKDKQVSVACHWMFHTSLSYYAKITENNHLKIVDYNKNIDSTNTYDYYLIFESDLPMLANKYNLIHRENTSVSLLKKK